MKSVIFSRYEPSKKRWVVLGSRTEKGEYLHDYTDERTGIIVPFGFEYDQASIPRLIWFILAPYELSEEAPAVHDYLYRHAEQDIALADGSVRKSTKEWADKAFLDVMADMRVHKPIRKIAYFCVKYFAGFTWRRHVRENKKAV